MDRLSAEDVALTQQGAQAEEDGAHAREAEQEAERRLASAERARRGASRRLGPRRRRRRFLMQPERKGAASRA